MTRTTPTRRRVLYSTAAVVGAGTLAGCTGDGGSGGGGDAPDRIDDYLSNAPNYDGGVEDATGRDEVTIEVGAGNGLAFAPPAVRVDAGTTVVWEWTGQGGAHNVDSAADSDAEFRSGDAVDSSSETFERTFDAAGIQLYHCDPHEAAGMRGGIEVVE